MLPLKPPWRYLYLHFNQIWKRISYANRSFDFSVAIPINHSTCCAVLPTVQWECEGVKSPLKLIFIHFLHYLCCNTVFAHPCWHWKPFISRLYCVLASYLHFLLLLSLSGNGNILSLHTYVCVSSFARRLHVCALFNSLRVSSLSQQQQQQRPPSCFTRKKIILYIYFDTRVEL